MTVIPVTPRAAPVVPLGLVAALRPHDLTTCIARVIIRNNRAQASDDART